MEDYLSIVRNIKAIGPVLPGSLAAFYNVCGKDGCRCKDKQNPQKHGPYYRLSYSLAGRNSSMFVKQEDVAKVKKMIEDYRKLRSLTLDLALATLDTVKQAGVTETLKLFESATNVSEGISWKDKCRKRTGQLRAAAVRIRDLTISRDKWRQECLELRKKTSIKKSLGVSEQWEKK